GALAELLLDLADGHLDGLQALAVVPVFCCHSFSYSDGMGFVDCARILDSYRGPVKRKRTDAGRIDLYVTATCGDVSLSPQVQECADSARPERRDPTAFCSVQEVRDREGPD